MDNNKLIIAVAGSGKTTSLVKEALKEKDGRILITTYTIANKEEIRKKFFKINKCIPENITVQTWFSFLLQHGVKPFQGTFNEDLFDYEIKGLRLVNEKSGFWFRNKKAKKDIYYSEYKNFKEHYFSKEQKIYSDKLSKFVVKCNEKSNGAVIDRLSRIYTHIFIDEVQDLAGYDLEILKFLFECKSNILLVGDPRQVTYLTHHEMKYGKYKAGKIKEFVLKECQKEICEIDETSKSINYRCVPAICKLSNKLYPDFSEMKSGNLEITGHDGVFLIRQNDIDVYLHKYNPIQLQNSRKETNINKKYKVINFGESKGLEFKRVLIYPTKPFINWLKNNYYSLKPISRSKFYVAITRAKFSVGIVYDYRENCNIMGIEKFSLNKEEEKENKN